MHRPCPFNFFYKILQHNLFLYKKHTPPLFLKFKCLFSNKKFYSLFFVRDLQSLDFSFVLTIHSNIMLMISQIKLKIGENRQIQFRKSNWITIPVKFCISIILTKNTFRVIAIDCTAWKKYVTFKKSISCKIWISREMFRLRTTWYRTVIETIIM